MAKATASPIVVAVAAQFSKELDLAHIKISLLDVESAQVHCARTR